MLKKKQEFDRSGMVDVEMSKLLFHLKYVLLNTTSKVGHSSVMSLVDNLCSQMQNIADKKFGNHHETITTASEKFLRAFLRGCLREL